MSTSVHPVLLRNDVHVRGPEDAETLVFSHGFGTDQSAWSNYIDTLSASYRCVSFDLSGCGKSDLNSLTARRYSSLYSYAQNLIEICDALNLRGVRLIAHSVSGMTSMLASLLRPDLFARIFAVGASPCYLNLPAHNYVGGFAPDDVRALLDSMSANYHSWASGFAPLVIGNDDKPELAEYFLETLLSIRPDVAQAILKVILLSNHRAELSRIPIPVRIAMGANDPAVPDDVGDYFAAHLADCTLVRLNATGHLPHISAPAVVGAALDSWLAA